MRCACPFMMSRNRSRALASSRAGPCRVSMKPSSEASGVRSSWLALATKSARMASSRRAEVRSRKNRTTPAWISAWLAASDCSGPIWTSKVRSVGIRSEYSTRRGSPVSQDLLDAVEHIRAAQGEGQGMPCLQAGQERVGGLVGLDHHRPLVHQDDRIRDMGQNRLGDARARRRLRLRPDRSAEAALRSGDEETGQYSHRGPEQQPRIAVAPHQGHGHQHEAGHDGPAPSGIPNRGGALPAGIRRRGRQDRSWEECRLEGPPALFRAGAGRCHLPPSSASAGTSLSSGLKAIRAERMRLRIS